MYMGAIQNYIFSDFFPLRPNCLPPPPYAKLKNI